jgi:hypothetical protein
MINEPGFEHRQSFEEPSSTGRSGMALHLLAAFSLSEKKIVSPSSALILCLCPV